jgi:nuclear pore complex protein Nup133
MQQQIQKINQQLLLIEHQSQIDENVLNSLGFDTNNLRVLKPEEMIELYISDDYSSATEVEFRKALELVAFVEDKLEYTNKIWCAAILKDNWLNVNMDSPFDKITEFLFFKLVDVCFLLDGNLEFLPSINVILSSPDLEDFLNHSSFQYLMKLCYEHIQENFK